MDIFEYAMQMEREGEEYYRDILSRTSEPGIKRIVEMLAQDEMKHYNVLKEMKKRTPKVSDTKILEDAKNIFTEMMESKERFDFLQSEVDLYRKAQEIEKKSREFYREKSKLVSDVSQRRLFLQFSEEERKHYFLLENLIEFVSRPQTWLENAEFFHLDEY